jgi:hypothetical protein
MRFPGQLTRYPNENKMYESNGEPEELTSVSEHIQSANVGTQQSEDPHTANPTLREADGASFVK